MSDPGPCRCYICHGRYSHDETETLLATMSGVKTICGDCCKLIDEWVKRETSIPMSAFRWATRPAGEA